VELVVPGQTVTGATKATRRRLPRTIAVGLVGLAVIAYLATAYSWFDDSIWGGVAFFVLFAALAIAYRADDDAARRRRVPQRPVT
jgi:CHASE2 domain-containing sensor protein